jgi:hypothetical protein
LELNLATEILNLLRNQWEFPKAYLRGLTQREEKQEGVDFFAHLNPKAHLFTFQFKAPRGKLEGTPYRFSVFEYDFESVERKYNLRWKTAEKKEGQL